ncbi:MAG: hypothetical protein K6E79_04880 [Pseudobutyrivibrio sp.]|nr:hypothetical protein [Pseudobutyrivibrio sp.]
MNSNEVQVIDKLIKRARTALTKAPNGSIRLCSSKGYPRFYYFESSNDDKGKYLSANDLPFITAICQRDYNVKLIERLESLKKQALKDIPFNLNNEIDEVYFAFKPGKQSVIKPIIPTINDYINEWYNNHPQQQNPFPFDSYLITNKGEKVRSKSEKIIADKLLALDIPYVYEPAVIINNTVKYPDFIILNKRLRKTFYWEHFGLADDEGYSESNLAKLADYEKNGLLIGEDVICSFETKDTPISSSTLDKKIMTHLQ